MVSAVEARLDGQPYGQDPAAEVEDALDNVEYVVTVPYQRNVHESDALADRSTGVDMQAPTPMRVTRICSHTITSMTTR